MTLELINYITSYYLSLSSQEDKINIKYAGSLLRHTEENIKKAINQITLYKNIGWLTDYEISDNPSENFIVIARINTIMKLIINHPDKIFINLCPQCNKLARTPYARQCRYCENDWH